MKTLIIFSLLIAACQCGKTTTTGPLNLYVDSQTGNDDSTNCGCPGAACRTIQTAVAKIPQRIRHKVEIKIAPDSYNGLLLPSHTFTSGGTIRLKLDEDGPQCQNPENTQQNQNYCLKK